MKHTARTLLALLAAAATAMPLRAQCDDINVTTHPGEVARYHAYYNWHFIWMNAGEVTFANRAATYRGRPAYRLSAIGSTYKSYDFFYRVRDTFEVVVDTLTLQPYHFSQRNYESDRVTLNDYRFDYDTQMLTGYTQSEDLPEGKHFSMALPQCSFDVLTMVYKARNIDFSRCAEGDKIPIRMIINAQSYDLYIRYLGRETIKTRTGRRFDCLKFSPLLVDGTLFKGGEDMTVWVTNDRNRVPILVEAKVLIGSVKAMFVDATGLKYPMTAEIVKQKK